MVYSEPRAWRLKAGVFVILVLRKRKNKSHARIFRDIADCSTIFILYSVTFCISLSQHNHDNPVSICYLVLSQFNAVSIEGRRN